MPRTHAPATTPPTAAAGSSAHPILHTPDDIAGWRRAFFTLEQDLYLSVEQFNQLWPYMINQWSNQGKTRNKYSVDHIFKCRFWREQQIKSRGEGVRSRSIRVANPCGMVCKVVYNYPAGRAEGRAPSSITVTKTKKSCSEHNHSLEDIDAFKRPEALMQAAAAEVLKNYQYYEVATAIKAPNILEAEQ